MKFKATDPDKLINSEQNEIYRNLLSCQTSKGIKEHGLFMVSGARAVRDTLERSPGNVRSLILCQQRHVEPTSEMIEDLILQARELTAKTAVQEQPRFSVLAFEEKLFTALDIFGTHAPLLLLNTPKVPVADLSLAPQGLELLCSLSDPANVGALLRSAAAFGASRVILLKESASPFHPKAVRAASAATLLTPLAKGPSVIELDALRTKDHAQISGKIVALDMKGERLDHFHWPADIRVLMGEEGLGVPSSQLFHRVRIAMKPDVESLNATVASSIALYSYRLKHPLK